MRRAMSYDHPSGSAAAGAAGAPSFARTGKVPVRETEAVKPRNRNHPKAKLNDISAMRALVSSTLTPAEMRSRSVANWEWSTFSSFGRLMLPRVTVSTGAAGVAGALGSATSWGASPTLLLLDLRVGGREPGPFGLAEVGLDSRASRGTAARSALSYSGCTRPGARGSGPSGSESSRKYSTSHVYEPRF